MNTDVISQSLLALGLGELEANLYAELLLGKMTNITKLANKFQVQRLRIYKALEELEKFGLIHKRGDELSKM